MVKKYKRVFSINNDLGYRNYTVRDLIDLKGEKKLTQIAVTNVEEAFAAEEAGIDLILTKSKKIIEIRTRKIEIFLFKFKITLKKIFPSKTLRIGIIKYPKLASII